MNGWMLTPIGIGIIGIYSAIVGVVILWPLSRLLRNSRWKRWIVSIVAIPFLAAPWAEEAWIAWHFGKACKDAGVKVYRQVEVEGFYDVTMQSAYAYIKDGGFEFMEHLEANGKILHVERPSGQWQKKYLDLPSARYHFKYAYQPEKYVTEEKIGWKLEKVERQVVDGQTGEILGRDTSIHRGAPIADALWAQFFGNSMTICPGPNVKPFVPPPPFPQAVLKPISRP